ncbi:MAG TPA: SDR family oxidoreductase [Solirubrobacteraceae bacterium]
MNELVGRVALDSGVSRRKGIGFAVAHRLAAMGADLMVHGFVPYDRAMPWGADADQDGLLDELRAVGTRVEPVEADFADPEAPGRVVEAAVAAFGHVDVLVANHTYSTRQPFLELGADEIDRHLAVIVRGTLLLARDFARQHDGRPGGRVVMLTSGQHLGPMGGEVAYAAAKGALHQLTWTLSNLLIDRGVTVNTVNPGPTDTGWAEPELHERARQAFPLGRWGQPDDAARLIAWLCTDEAQWVTGQVINSEGGVRRG